MFTSLASLKKADLACDTYIVRCSLKVRLLSNYIPSYLTSPFG